MSSSGLCKGGTTSAEQSSSVFANLVTFPEFLLHVWLRARSQGAKMCKTQMGALCSDSHCLGWDCHWAVQDGQAKVGVGTEKTVGAVCLSAGCWKMIRCLGGGRGGELGVEKPETRLLPPFLTLSYLGFSAWVLLLDFPLKQQKIKISHLSLFSCFREMKLKNF